MTLPFKGVVSVLYIKESACICELSQESGLRWRVRTSENNEAFAHRWRLMWALLEAWGSFPSHSGTIWSGPSIGFWNS